jgi:hypothetical protein
VLDVLILFGVVEFVAILVLLFLRAHRVRRARF